MNAFQGHSAQPPFNSHRLLLRGLVGLAACLTYVLWPDEPVANKPKTVAVSPAPVAPVASVEFVEPKPEPSAKEEPMPLNPELAQEQKVHDQPEFKEVPVTEQLKDYYINQVELNQVQLGRAVSLLRQKLQDTDEKHALSLQRLVISTPTQALGRRVTLFANSISYLQAVENVATQAGCAVEITKNRITLQLLPGPFPQVAQRRSAKEIFAGQVGEDGKPLHENQNALAILMESLGKMGLSVDENADVSLTPQQLAALQKLNQQRLQGTETQLPPYLIYILPRFYLSLNYSMDVTQILQVITFLQRGGFVPFLRIPASYDFSQGAQIVEIYRSGHHVLLTVYDRLPVPSEEQQVVAVPSFVDVPEVEPSYASASFYADLTVTIGLSYSATSLQEVIEKAGVSLLGVRGSATIGSTTTTTEATEAASSNSAAVSTGAGDASAGTTAP